MASQADPATLTDLQVARADHPVIVGFLNNEPASIRVFSGWAASVARYHAWGFETPEDVVQTTLLALVENFRQGRFREGNLPAYVRRIAKNICVNMYRRERLRSGANAMTPVDTMVPSRDPSPDLLSMLDRVLQGLEAACRALVLAAYYQGLERKEIALRLGISETAVKVRLHRCMERARVMQDRGCR
jgi:RNA polymerase sigma-70 factor, ECF subfamily